MKNIAIAMLAAALLAGSVGCKKKQTKPDPEPVEQTEAEPTEEAPSGESQEATGDERAALLALQRVHFAFDSSDLTEESRTALTEAATSLKKLPKVELYVDGHADSKGTTEYNLQLGERRAMAVRAFLARLGVNEDALHIVSFGEEQPLQEGADAENRRVDFRLMRGEIELVVEEGATE